MIFIKSIKFNFSSVIVFCILIASFIFSGCETSQNVSGYANSENVTASTVTSDSKLLTVNYIDVGQADSILIQSPNGHYMLIDAGETKEKAVLDYLNGYGIKKLDVVVATHPHDDHISEMADVINNFDVGEFYMPKKQHTTKGFENMIDALTKKNVPVKEAKAGVTIDFDESLKCSIVAPCKSEYKDLNNYSAVIKITYGNNKFLFTGDAESLSENEIIESGADISADVLKVGHHGSSSSTSKAFLEKVSPKYAIISAGKDNDYGHPHKETLDILNKNNVEIFGTYNTGSVIAISDGNNIKFNAGGEVMQSDNSSEAVEFNTEENNKSTENVNAVNNVAIQYIGNKNSKKYHLESCKNLPAEKNRILFNSKEDAINQGFSPCSNCNP